METFISEIETFLQANEWAETRFGVEVLNDKNFVSDLRKGRDVRTSTVEKVRNWMASYKPESKAA